MASWRSGCIDGKSYLTYPIRGRVRQVGRPGALRAGGAGRWTTKRGSESAETEIFDLQVLVDAVLRAFAPDAGFLDAAKRRDFCGDQSGVHAYDPVFECLGDAPDATDVASIEVRGEAELRSVRDRDGLGFRVELEERREGTEGLLTRDLHVGVGVANDRGHEKSPAPVGA